MIDFGKKICIQTEASFHANHEQGMGGAKANVEEEKEEVLLIVKPDAVVDPGAVMVGPSLRCISCRSSNRKMLLNKGGTSSFAEDIIPEDQDGSHLLIKAWSIVKIFKKPTKRIIHT